MHGANMKIITSTVSSYNSRHVVGGRGEGEEMHTGFWWVNINNRDYLEEPGVDGRTILKQIQKTTKRGDKIKSSGLG